MKRFVTGIKPTGTPHLGNYLGMIRPSLALAAEYESYIFIADYHALTTVRDGSELRDLTYDVAATWLALGLDPERTVLYRQSDVPGVCELAWILDCVTPKGLLNRAHAYKAAVDDNQLHGRDADAGVNAGLFNYPVLMAADILYPCADVVPVGQDQKQHIEITDDIAASFNAIYGPILTIPDAIIDERVMTIPGLDGRKMSKSYDNIIPILAPSNDLHKAVRRIVTDSRRPEEPKNPETDTIFQLFQLVASEPTVSAMADRYRAGGLGYGEAKDQLFTALDEIFAPARERYEEMSGDRAAMDRVLAEGAERVRAVADPLLARVREVVGVTPHSS